MGIRGQVRLHVALCAVVTAVLLTAACGTSKRPNVLLISVDTLRSDHLHCYGYEYETSPNIDRLAAEGVRFSQMVSSSSWTLPAHVTMLTGIPPYHHGVVVEEKKLGPEVVTLAEAFAAEGYDTAGFISGVYLLPEYGLDQGFETYDYSAGIESKAISMVTSPKMEKVTTDWLKGRGEEEPERPFFVFLHLFDVHFDFMPAEPYASMFDPGYEGPVDGVNFVHSDVYNPEMSDRDYKHLLALYDGEIRLTDHHIGNVLDYLESTGELDDTIVVVTGDHGEEFFEHDRKGHRMTLFEEVIRVPLIIRYPRRIRPGKVVDDQVRLMDIPATIFDLAGMDSPPGFGMPEEGVRFRSQSLVPWIKGRRDLPVLVSNGELHDELFSVRTERMKMVYHWSRDWGQFFDLEEDPKETHNLYYERAKEAAHMVAEIRAFRNAAPRPKPAQPHKLSEEQIERLRSLGYVK